jgi:hypothetical protein
MISPNQFVSIAKGSVGEIRAQLIYALDFGYLNSEAYSNLDQLGKTAAACLGGLIRHLNDSKLRGRKFRHRDLIQCTHRSHKLNAEGQTFANAER